MSKRKLTKHQRDCLDRGDLSFCYDVQFRPEGTLFSQLDTPYSVLVPFDLPEAGNFLYDVGAVFHTLTKETQQSFHNCILVFTDQMLKNPHEHVNYSFGDAAVMFFELLAAEKNGSVVVDLENNGAIVFRDKQTTH